LAGAAEKHFRARQAVAGTPPKRKRGAEDPKIR
jgi:hypothetical protein